MARANRSEADKWKRKIERSELLFDRSRASILAAWEFAKSMDPHTDPEQGFEALLRDLSPGGKYWRWPNLGPRFPSSLSVFEAFTKYVEEHGPKPERSDPVRSEWGTTLGSMYVNHMLKRDITELFVIDHDLAVDIVESSNEPLAGDDLENLPFSHSWFEFSKPIEIAVGPKRALNVEAVILAQVENYPLRVMSMISDVPTKPGPSVQGVDVPILQIHDAVFLVAMSGFGWVSLGIDPGLAEHLGIDVNDWNNDFESLIQAVKVAGRNLYDFVTSRSFDYETRARRAHDFSKFRRYKHAMKASMLSLRHYKMVAVNRTVESSSTDKRSQEIEASPYQVKVPGAFHRWVYCQDCGRVHRHDLIGQPCRDCKQQVGPTANIRVEKYWHPPYTRGHGGPTKREVRHLVERGPRI